MHAPASTRIIKTEAVATQRRPPAAEPGKGIDKLCIDTIRTLAIDAVQKAQSGHAGAPMGLAPVGHTLWQDFLRYDPTDPLWANRDRFVLSAGHACLLLYALLHLSGVRRVEGSHITDGPAVSLDDIKSFRQLDSVTPGHPEYGRTTGVEATTGPLGQGCGNSVGMAIASRWLGARYNRPGFTIFDSDVYYITTIPSDVRWPNIITIGLAAFLLTGIATLYPAIRASRTPPAEALRYE